SSSTAPRPAVTTPLEPTRHSSWRRSGAPALWEWTLASDPSRPARTPISRRFVSIFPARPRWAIHTQPRSLPSPVAPPSWLRLERLRRYSLLRDSQRPRSLPTRRPHATVCGFVPHLPHAASVFHRGHVQSGGRNGRGE